MAEGMKCPAGHTRVWKKGVVPTRTGQKARYVCFVCGKTFYKPESKPKTAKPKAKVKK